METQVIPSKSFTATRNACKLCAPLGSSLVFKGIEGCVPMIHGSQGCATYIRRYLISHYKEPVDIASSNFSEESTIFGGRRNFIQSVQNIVKQYKPEVIGVSSTCLSETIGEDIPAMIREYSMLSGPEGNSPLLIHAPTPSYQGSHADGFHQAATATVAALSQSGKTAKHINLFPGMVSPADLRYLREICEDFKVETVLFPDYSQTLDGVFSREYALIPEGGTSLKELRLTGSAQASMEFGTVFNKGMTNGRVKKTGKYCTAGEWLEHHHQVPNIPMPFPIGLEASDRFFETFSKIRCTPVPEKYRRERGRLLDSYVDGHKYAFGKKVFLYGEEDLVLGMLSFLEEIGIETVLIASGGNSGLLAEEVKKIRKTDCVIGQDMDFETMQEWMDKLKPDLMIGNSKGYYLARQAGIPLVRIGFPIHDRFGGQRIEHLGYRGTQRLFDTLMNALIEVKQEKSPVGYKYI